MADIRNFNVEQFLDWLSDQDLANINNHGEGDEAEVEDHIVENVANIGLEDEEDFDDIDEGIELDREDMVEESTVLSKRLNVRENAGAVYCTTMSFVKVPTDSKNYLLCQLCYWRYLDRCHPLTNHQQASVHRTTNIQEITRLYCGVCECNLFTICNIATCAQCNQVPKK